MTVQNRGSDLLLVCDDERRLLRLYLRALGGFELRTSFKIEGLLELVRRAIAEGRRFCLLLDGQIKVYRDDVEEPNGETSVQTGQEALAQVKALLAVENKPELLRGTLFCSGTAGYDRLVIPLGTAQHPVWFLAKPFGMEELREAVRRLMAAPG